MSLVRAGAKATFPEGWKTAADNNKIYGWKEFKARGLYKPDMKGIILQLSIASLPW